LKLEKEYLELQSKAFAAPGSALAEVRGLREEMLRVKRDKALGDAKEAEVRRELAALKRQVRVHLLQQGIKQSLALSSRDVSSNHHLLMI
jgi:hypothetical protein